MAPTKAAFPEVKVIAASATIAAIRDDVESKFATWGPQLGENAPRTLADIIMPDVFDGRALTLEGQNMTASSCFPAIPKAPRLAPHG